MLLIRVLCDASEEGEGERPLDVFVSIDGGRNARHDALPDALILAEGGNGANVLVCHAGRLAGLVLPESGRKII